MFIVGIDPGKNGGIVSLTNGKITTIDAMPSTIEGIWNHFLYLGFPNMIKKEETYVFIEDVHSMPTDGHVGAFSFGRHMGHLDTVLSRLVHNVVWIRPREWMQSFDLKRDKQESKYNYKKRILQLAKGKTQKTLAQQITLKTCDAYLIALYGYNQIKEKS